MNTVRCAIVGRQQLQVGAAVLDEWARSARTLPSRVGRQLDVLQSESRPWMVATIASVRSSIHFTGAPELVRCRSGDELLGVGVQLGAEPAADVGGDHAHLAPR